jgi:hypothetical protein
MPTYRMDCCGVVPINIQASATITADSEYEAKCLLLGTRGDPKRLANLEVEEERVFDPHDYIHDEHPIEIGEIEDIENIPEVIIYPEPGEPTFLDQSWEQNRDRIQAIRAVHEETGCGIQEAIKRVDAGKVGDSQ